MTTMVSIFARSARVAVSETPGGADNSLLAQEQRPATRPSATIECTSNEWREAHIVAFIMNFSIRRAATRRATNAAAKRHCTTPLGCLGSNQRLQRRLILRC